uniref:CCHC-type domain-containing protein n=1 Tax=Monopterus albus TaxID=43700 RepID=A0A3Q3JSN3_MONAL
MPLTMINKLRNWCRGQALDENHAFLTIVSENTEIFTIEETLQTIKCLGRVRVRGRMLTDFADPSAGILVLCECKGNVSKSEVPSEISPAEGVTAWPLVTVKERVGAELEFSHKLSALLQAEGKSMADVQALLPKTLPASSPTKSVLRAVGDLLDKTNRSSESGYRRLRMFSGMVPTPVGEEQFDHWLEQAYLMVEESEGSLKEKSRRIMESLKGPALEIIKAVHLSDSDRPPEKYLEALESAFGTAESGDDLYFAFHLLQQQPREKLSDFLRQLERTLSKVVQRGGIPQTHMDRARLEQLLRGAVASDIMLIQLRLRERKNKPPTFLQLLSEIRAEEEYEASRMKLRASVHQLHTKQIALTKQVKRLQNKLSKKNICYRCGENGHFADKCQNPENQSKVIRSLIQALKLAKESQPPTHRSEPNINCTAKKSLMRAVIIQTRT